MNNICLLLMMWMLIGFGLTACDPAPPPVLKPEGRWISEQQSILMLRPDGTFSISRRSETPDEMHGTYKIGDGDKRLEFHSDLDQACSDVVGVYVYDIQRRVMTLTKVIDDCNWRENEMIYPWIKMR